LVLFIDEADAFLRRGRAGTGAMSEDARNVPRLDFAREVSQNHGISWHFHRDFMGFAIKTW
jgi:hypothetical protein